MKKSEFTIELLEALAEYLEARNSMKQYDKFSKEDMTQRRHRGIVCPYCHKFLDFSFGFEEATGVVCLYCRADVPVSDELMVGLVEVGE